MSRTGKRSSRSCDAPRRSGARGFVAAAARRAFFIALAALTAGCGAQRSVTVFHLFREPGVPDERYAALRNVEIDFPAPASSAAAQRGEALLRALGSRSGVPSGYAVDNVAFGFVLSRALEANGAGVAGFRTVLGGDFHPDLDATGFLTVHPVRVTFGRSERVAEEIHTDKKGRRARVAVRMADFSAVAALDVALTDKTGRPLFAEVIQSRAQTQETRADAATGDAFFSALQERAVEDVARAAADRICPVRIETHYRPLLRVKDQKDSEDAFAAAARERWLDAERIWRARIDKDPNDWRDRVNLAVSAEQRRDYASARAFYEDARSHGAADPEAQKMPWNELIGSLNGALFGDAAPSPKGWFAQRVAILPFSDESVFVDASDLGQTAVTGVLESGGYRLVPPSEVADILRQHGVSEGGQLAAFKPEQIADWLNADRLVYGNLDEFNEVNVGIYRKRVVSGEIRLWDRSTGADIWTGSEKVSNQSLAVNGNGIAASFVGGLANAWIERLRKKPLGPETEAFARGALRSLPLRPTR